MLYNEEEARRAQARTIEELRGLSPIDPEVKRLVRKWDTARTTLDHDVKVWDAERRQSA